jgi:hypothetical protein
MRLFCFPSSSILTIPNSDVPTVFQSVLQVEVWDKDMGSGMLNT